MPIPGALFSELSALSFACSTFVFCNSTSKRSLRKKRCGKKHDKCAVSSAQVRHLRSTVLIVLRLHVPSPCGPVPFSLFCSSRSSSGTTRFTICFFEDQEHTASSGFALPSPFLTLKNFSQASSLCSMGKYRFLGIESIKEQK